MTLDEIINSPDPEYKKDLSHVDSKFLLKISSEYRTGEVLERLVKMHEPLVVKEASKYWKKFSSQVCRILDVDDLISSGFCGLLKAIKRYNHSYNTEFSTYAVYWIDQSIRREIDDCTGIVRIPVHAIEKLRRTLYEGNNDSEKYNDNIKLKHRFIHSISVDDIAKKDSVLLRDSLVDGNNVFSNNLSKLNNPETKALFEDVRNRLILGIESYCNERNAALVFMRYGLKDNFIPETLNDVGTEFGITRERVRQVCETVLGKLKNGKYISKDDIEGMV